MRGSTARLLQPIVASFALFLSSCHPTPSGAWPLDLWSTLPEVEAAAPAPPWSRPFTPRTVTLGAAEVRDLSQISPEQLKIFPQESGGQIHALEQRVGSRLRWHTGIGSGAYFSYVPLGDASVCPCTYRVSVRSHGQLAELSRTAVPPLGRFAPAAIEVDLARYAGQEIDLLLQVEGPHSPLPTLLHHLMPPIPAALWGSPMLFQRQAVLAAAPSEPGSRADSSQPSQPRQPNILLIGIDTLRADAIGAYKPRQPSLTPAIDRLAAHADLYLNAWSAANSTNPSFSSIHSGLYLKDTGVYDLHTPLPKDRPTLAAELAKAGYDTMAIISAHHLRDQNSGLGRGFATVVTAPERFAGELSVNLALDWLTQRAPRAGRRPFFLWLHLFDPHTPHVPPKPYADGLRPAGPVGLAPVASWLEFRPRGPRAYQELVLAGSRDLYDGEVAYADQQVGRLLGFLEDHGLLAQTLVVLTADHGENEGEHGLLFRHIGLWPGSAPRGRRVAAMVQSIDLFPALLKTAGLAPPPSDGRDLRDLTAAGRPGRREVFAEAANHAGAMVRTANYKYMVSTGTEKEMPSGPYLYDLSTDPTETMNLAGRGLGVERELATDLARWQSEPGLTSGTTATPQNLSNEETARLRSLGY